MNTASALQEQKHEAREGGSWRRVSLLGYVCICVNALLIGLLAAGAPHRLRPIDPGRRLGGERHGAAVSPVRRTPVQHGCGGTEIHPALRLCSRRRCDGVHRGRGDQLGAARIGVRHALFPDGPERPERDQHPQHRHHHVPPDLSEGGTGTLRRDLRRVHVPQEVALRDSPSVNPADVGHHHDDVPPSFRNAPLLDGRQQRGAVAGASRSLCAHQRPTPVAHCGCRRHRDHPRPLVRQRRARQSGEQRRDARIPAEPLLLLLLPRAAAGPGGRHG